MNVVVGGDGLLYGYRVTEFRKYLNNIYGPATIIKKSEQHISSDDFRSKKGIIGFDVLGWGDATGHFSLWDGYNVLYQGDHDYFNFPQRRMPNTASLDKVSLWTCSS